jgi:hypothetical protein
VFFAFPLIGIISFDFRLKFSPKNPKRVSPSLLLLIFFDIIDIQVHYPVTGKLSVLCHFQGELHTSIPKYYHRIVINQNWVHHLHIHANALLLNFQAEPIFVFIVLYAEVTLLEIAAVILRPIHLVNL